MPLVILTLDGRTDDSSVAICNFWHANLRDQFLCIGQHGKSTSLRLQNVGGE